MFIFFRMIYDRSVRKALLCSWSYYLVLPIKSGKVEYSGDSNVQSSEPHVLVCTYISFNEKYRSLKDCNLQYHTVNRTAHFFTLFLWVEDKRDQ